MEQIWDDVTALSGITLKARFIAPDTPFGSQDLSFLGAHQSVKTLIDEESNQRFFVGNVVAKPTAVYDFAGELICLVNKYKDGRSIYTRDNWRRQIALEDALWAAVGAYAVAQSYRKVTAAMLRLNGAVVFVAPEDWVMDIMLDLADLGVQYFNDGERISAKRLGTFAAEKVRYAFGKNRQPGARNS